MKPASESPPPLAAALASPRAVFIALLVVAATLISVDAISPVALLVIIREGLWAAGIILGATGLGLVAMRIVRPPTCPLRWELLGAAGLGLGLLSLLVLGLGAAGIMHRAIWFALLGVFYLAGAVCLVRRKPSKDDDAASCEANGGDGWTRWLLLGVVPFAILAALAATMPPGTIWPEEGSGYDVLEYHLGAPRDYFEAGRISYLPNNIYSNQPLNVEMLYLLAMILHGGAVPAAFTANLLHLLLGALVVACVWLGAREYGRGAGVVAAVAAASCPFAAYLCGMAYNENGMSLFAALAVAAVLRAGRLAPEQRVRWLILAGLFVGFACGCKYTAVPMVLLPVACAVVWLAIHSASRRLAQPAVFTVAALAVFAPWLVKNAVATGNPLFPLAREVFHERPGTWDDDGAARWHEGHLPAPEDRPLSRRLARLGSEVLYSKMYGPLPILAVVLGGCGMVVSWVNRGRHVASPSGRAFPQEDAYGVPVGHGGPTLQATGKCSSPRACWVMLLFGIITWLALTHLAGRFAIVLVVPCSLLIGLAWSTAVRPLARLAGVLLLAGTVAANAFAAAGFFSPGGMSLFKADVFGRMELVTQGHWPGHQHVPRLNEVLSRGEKILVVGDARRFYLDRGADYCVVFNRNPFAEAAAAMPPAAMMNWLRERHYAYVYVDWAEMHRLRTTRYGFWGAVDAALFTQLSEVGLQPLEQFRIAGRQSAYATLFRVSLEPGR